MKQIGMLEDLELSDRHKQFIAEKREEFNARNAAGKVDDGQDSFLEQVQLCSKCQTKALVMLDGCMTCLNCGDSKCS